ncbi:hypothetical protein Aph02nite_25420 [Actinoplanes philippinensis]|uniref:Uncharacterized protein n=1 Tax=Actinoplanes philippinensis TaxID=35752 RepID=A0A1I2G6K0_9ACTN|nr:hypothetical protein [Actinoplanes philippinensis]GIE76592.1 hypothetical protein Aph02nite_25420 [Actinoplanes philippinensis]SFF12241.1 hypothetical protein SAMN05421541_106199 [Actinoplanes philippinensis]
MSGSGLTEARIRRELDDAWSRTVLVQVVAGGENGGPIDDRELLAEIDEPGAVGEVRALTTTGRFSGDICRCHGGPTIVLRDGEGEVVLHAGIHGFGSISWDRSRFRNDLDVSDPTALHLLLARHGVPHQLALFWAPLTAHLKSRRAGKADPAAQPVLAEFSGRRAGDVPADRIEDARQRLAAAIPAPADRAAALLSWLGGLPAPGEALLGGGAVARALLADFSPADLVAAVTGADSAHAVMGVINLAMHGDDDPALAAAVAPILRRLLRR